MICFRGGFDPGLKFSPSHVNIVVAHPPHMGGNDMEALLTKIQKLIAVALAVLLVIVVTLSTVHLGFLIAEEIWTPPRFLIPVQGLLEIFSFFLLILIGVELLETLKAYLRRDVIHVRLVLEVALIAMARKVIILEPNNIPAATLFGLAALILALAVAFYFERQAHREQPS
ncbi:MAG: phosphate-starvation-inducible PsiE family protein [Candidatus Sulfotelmatobacter sp.]